MTKSELINELAAANPHLQSSDVETIVGTIFSEITAALSRGERVELRGFGAFTVKKRDARTGRNPRTGAAVPVDEEGGAVFSRLARNCASGLIAGRAPVVRRIGFRLAEAAQVGARKAGGEVK